MWKHGANSAALSRCVCSIWLYGSLPGLCCTGGSLGRSATGLLWDRFIEKHLFSISSTVFARCSHWDLRQILCLTGWPTLKRDANIEQRKKNTSIFPKGDLGIHLTFKLFSFHSTVTRRKRPRLINKNKKNVSVATCMPNDITLFLTHFKMKCPVSAAVQMYPKQFT